MGILDSLKRAEEIEPLYEQNGVKVVSFEDQRAAAQAEITEGVDLGNRTVNPDGTIARSRTKYAAINPDYLYMNRYKKIGTKLVLVTDYRAIKEQSRGRVYLRQIPAYVISRNPDTKELVLDKVITVSDTEFIGEYTRQLSPAAMKQIIPLLQSETLITQDDLVI